MPTQVRILHLPLMWFLKTSRAAHEWGHHIQGIKGIPRPARPAESVQVENQADCIAGAWVAYAETQGWVEYPDDTGDIEVILKEIASSETDVNRDHGTLSERSSSLMNGYHHGLEGCNE